jgi:signal transduction histidine kinase
MGLAEVARVLVKDKAALELFEKVQENAINLDKMLRKLQSISDVGGQEVIYKEVFIRDLFDIELDKLKEVMERKKIVSKISIEVSHSFYSYPALIKIIIENLLENAIAFSATANPVIQLKAYEEDHQIGLQVADNGMGIDPVYQDRVFDMYFRANELSTGNGLGLYIVKKMVQKLNGRISLESKLGQGTKVTIYFPQRLE